MKCMDVMQCKSQKQKETKQQEKNGYKEFKMKYKNHVRKTQLD